MLVRSVGEIPSGSRAEDIEIDIGYVEDRILNGLIVERNGAMLLKLVWLQRQVRTPERKVEMDRLKRMLSQEADLGALTPMDLAWWRMFETNELSVSSFAGIIRAQKETKEMRDKAALLSVNGFLEVNALARALSVACQWAVAEAMEVIALRSHPFLRATVPTIDVASHRERLQMLLEKATAAGATTPMLDDMHREALETLSRCSAYDKPAT